MVSVKEHVFRLSKFCTDSPQDIYKCIMTNRYMIDDDSLFCWSINNQSNGKTMTVLFASGDGPKIFKWIQEVAHEERCVKIYCITQRPKAIERKYGFKPTGTLMEMEG